MIIDFHNHFYPEAYIQELRRDKAGYTHVSTDNLGQLLIEYVGDYNIVVGPHVKLEERLEAMGKFGIDMEVLSLTTPGVERESIEKGIKLARLTNDEFGEISEKYPDQFTALAALPMQDPEAAVQELERAIRDCGLRGAMLFSNANGKPLDSPEFWPVYEKAAKLDIPMFVHPTTPINYSAMEDYRLVPILGFTVDTSLAVLRLVFSGVLEKFPSLKLVMAHTGGVFPYIRGRIEIGYNKYAECRINIPRPPSEYFKKNVWVDTVCYDPDVLMSTYAFTGPDKVVLGTDFPHQISDMENAVRRVKGLDIGDAEKRKILGDNAAKLLKL